LNRMTTDISDRTSQDDSMAPKQHDCFHFVKLRHIIILSANHFLCVSHSRILCCLAWYSQPYIPFKSNCQHQSFYLWIDSFDEFYLLQGK
jgi:hypothetical protein